MTRRSFLCLPAVAPLVRFGFAANVREPDAHHFAYDHVIGTSLDLDVWTSSAAAAQHAENAALNEIRRLTSILNTRDPGSEISRLQIPATTRMSQSMSAELGEVLALYDRWAARTGGRLSIRPRGPGTPLNVDALGKAFILDRAAAAALSAAPELEGLLLNIGGDIVVRGRAVEIGVSDPLAWQDNATPAAWIQLRDAAIATSGGYARGAHLLDARTGLPSLCAASATVTAHDAVTANALATTLCVTDADDALQLVESIAGAEAMLIGVDGAIHRSSGFARLERPRTILTRAVADNWPAGYELNISLTLTAGAPPMGGRGGFGGGFGGPGGRGGFTKRQYVAVWIENTSGKLVRVLAFWADKARYYSELSSFVGALGRNSNRLSSLARATRAPGNYRLVWDGLDDNQMPVPPGTYRVVVETNQEHGSYGKQAGTIECNDKPAEASLPATSNFEVVTIQFGPRPKQA